MPSSEMVCFSKMLITFSLSIDHFAKWFMKGFISQKSKSKNFHKKNFCSLQSLDHISLIFCCKTKSNTLIWYVHT